jgi:endonuclease
MPIYERPTKSLMADWAKDHLSPGQMFNKAEAVRWFSEHYPKIKSNTVRMHVEGTLPGLMLG